MDRIFRVPFLAMLAAVAILVASLRLAQPVLLPLAVAVLLSVVLAPLVRRVERLRIGRIPSVLVVTVGVAALLLGVGWMIGSQAALLVDRLPEYRENAEEKLRTLRASLLPVEQAAKQVQELEREITQGGQGPAPEEPAKVDVVEDDVGPLTLVRDYAGSVLAPFATIGLVLVLLIFLLIQREDLRDRLIRVLGSRDLHLTTTAMDDAGQRVTRYLRAYSLLNGGHGLVVGLGLWLFGLPAPLLFGLLSALLRFVPYLGPWIAATLPVALSFAVFDGWGTTLGIVGFLVAVELVSNNAVEPWLYGSSVGLSPFAVIVSAIFWTWLWGPVGLVLATPLTVCLVVLGKHLPQLEFLCVLLSDEPALDPPIRLYQRLLARDLDEATDLVAECAEERGLVESWDELLLPALALLERDRRRDLLDEERLAFARETLEVLVALSPPDTEPEPEAAEPLPAAGVLCLPARDYGDEIVCRLLAKALEREGLGARASRRLLLGEMVELTAAADVHLVCVSALTAEGQRTVRHLTGRILARRPDVRIVLGLWQVSREGVEALRQRLGVDRRVRLVTSVAEARETLCGLARTRELRARGSAEEDEDAAAADAPLPEPGSAAGSR